VRQLSNTRLSTLFEYRTHRDLASGVVYDVAMSL